MKTVCIYHSIDLDGWMSAAIVKHWYLTHVIPNDKSIGDMILNTMVGEYIPKEPIFEDTNNLWFIGYNYGQPIPNLSKYDKIIMCDISFPKEEMKVLANKLSDNFIWIDHHISAIKDNYFMLENGNEYIYNGLRDTNHAACELTWKYFFPNEPMPEIVRLLGRYDCFGHKGTDEEQKVLEFQYGARQVITNYETAYDYLVACINEANNGYDFTMDASNIGHIYNKGCAIYDYLCVEAKQSYKNGFPIWFHSGVNEELGKEFICINKERFNPINFGIDYHKDGYDGAACFHRRNDGKWAFSLYNDNEKVDCSEIAKRYGGGGHKGAAGFILTEEQFIELIK